MPHDPDAAVVLLETLKGQVKATIAEIRRVVYALRPPVLDELGLISALRPQIQRAWDKELQALREEIFAKAKEVEEITVTLSPKNIEVTRYLILWATRV